MVFNLEPRPVWARPYLNRICSIGSYLCVHKFKGDRILSLVDEPRLCDLSVITGPVMPLRALLDRRGSFSACLSYYNLCEIVSSFAEYGCNSH
ncbi:hypothetical protein GOBAR_DD07607 [Gossypium barbadense]|nr:hypothetical protein GOBAR_DD07607 [Gossypium barbadense]